MDKIILTLHVAVCVLLVIFVLLQSGREGMGVIFGGGSGSLFGSSGAGGILVRLTTVAAIIFFCTSLTYSIVTSDKESSSASRVRQVNIEEVAPQQPVAPAPLEQEQPAAQE
ncbi:MAG: preprotein translocase subunit SecG [Deltaproteobacteria bacterium]|nr:preprotein translocase subunit SecG [Deltaproteobacteria bacterium]